MAEVKLTGNCLKGSRPLLCFDSTFDTTPAYKLLKELLSQSFGAPKGHPKVKPFIDHIFSFFIADGRVWFRNYQVVYDLVDPEAAAAAGAQEQGNTTSRAAKQSAEKPVLVEIGPRFVLNPIKIFGGSFGGATLWENKDYVSPNTVRASVLAARANKYDNRTKQIAATQQHRAGAVIPSNPIDTVFEDEQDE
jgi:ribosome biogenesis protein BRX1